MSKKIQYQQNIEIIEKFFSKPLVLLTGIFSILSSLIFSVLNFLPNFPVMTESYTDYIYLFIQKAIAGDKAPASIGEAIKMNPSVFVIDIFPILIGVTFILLYCSSKSNKLHISYSATLFRIFSIIQFVFSLLFTVILVASLIIALTFIPTFATVGMELIAIACLTLIILSTTSQMRFAKSVNNSINSVFISSSGAKLYSILCFINTGIFALGILFVIFVFLTAGLIFDNPDYPWLITNFLITSTFFVSYLLSALTSISYVKYVNGIFKGTVTLTSNDSEPVVSQPIIPNDVVPEITFPEVPVGDVRSINNLVAPAEKEYNSPKTIDLVQEASLLAEFPDLAGTSVQATCPDCGNPITIEDVFCDLCGKKLQ